MDDLHRALARALTNVRKLNRWNARAYLKEKLAREKLVGKFASALGWPGINKNADVDLLLQWTLQHRADLAQAKITIARLSQQLKDANIMHYIEGS